MMPVEQRWLRAEIRYHEDAIARIRAAAELEDRSRVAEMAIRRISLRVDVIRRVLAIVERSQAVAA